ncbi:MAG: hypothetical protein ABIJ59_09320 [Pseudomonadota bacterium]
MFILIENTEPHNIKGDKKLSEKQKQAYRSFYDSARHNEVLETKTTILLHFVSAMAFGCYP